MAHIFIDESTSINIKNRTGYFATSYVYCKKPEILREAMNRVLIRMRSFGKYPDMLHELKFYPQWHKLVCLGYSKDSILGFKTLIHDVRIQSISAVKENCDGILVSCLDNKTTVKSWESRENLENFVTKYPLIYHLIPTISLAIPPVICFDKGRVVGRNMDNYYSYLENNPYGITRTYFHSANSLSEPCIWAADMVSGAFFYNLKENNSVYADLISSKFIGRGIIKYWNKGAPP